jgi:putative ABC transport system substrate-binding protein
LRILAATLTGVSTDEGVEIWTKRLQLLREGAPAISRIGLIGSYAWTDTVIGRDAREAMRQIGTVLVGSPMHAPFDEAAYRSAFASMAEGHADAFMTSGEVENQTNRRIIIALAAEARLPGLSPYREFVESGGLIAYGWDLLDAFRHVAQQVAQILQGAKPADIPFFQENKWDFLVNLKTAKALGLTIPFSLIAQADEVIE